MTSLAMDTLQLQHSGHAGKETRLVAKVGTQSKDYEVKVGCKYDHTMLNWSKSKSDKTINKTISIMLILEHVISCHWHILLSNKSVF